MTYLAGIQFPIEATRKISQAILDRHSSSAPVSSSSITVNQCRGPGAASPSPSPTPLSSSPSPSPGGAGTGTDWEFNCYADVGSMYLSRIPFWVGFDIIYFFIIIFIIILVTSRIVFICIASSSFIIYNSPLFTIMRLVFIGDLSPLFFSF